MAFPVLWTHAMSPQIPVILPLMTLPATMACFVMEWKPVILPLAVCLHKLQTALPMVVMKQQTVVLNVPLIQIALMGSSVMELRVVFLEDARQVLL